MENAHPALISEEEAVRIHRIRQASSGASFSRAVNRLRKEFIRRTVDKIELAPERMEVTISCRIPEPVLNGIACRDTNGSGGPVRWLHDLLARELRRVYRQPRNGRRTSQSN